jgi:16S rRNA (uracil1498-N3)-methyltransferase
MNSHQGEGVNSSPRVRLYVTAPLAPDGAVALTPAQAHYLGAVMRLVPGAVVRLFNGRDGEWLATVAALRRDSATVTVTRQTRCQQPEPGPHLLFAPLKKDAMDTVVIKATELGVAALRPVLTRRTATARVNLTRLMLQAAEAAEQCGRLTLPLIAPPAPLDHVLAAWPAERRLFVADPTAPLQSPLVAFAAVAAAEPPAFLIGPEGGFTTDELDRIARQPFVNRIRLGPRTLRAETAAIAALACWQAGCGDWRVPPPSSSPLA